MDGLTLGRQEELCRRRYINTHSLIFMTDDRWKINFDKIKKPGLILQSKTNRKNVTDQYPGMRNRCRADGKLFSPLLGGVPSVPDQLMKRRTAAAQPASAGSHFPLAGWRDCGNAGRLQRHGCARDGQRRPAEGAAVSFTQPGNHRSGCCPPDFERLPGDLPPIFASVLAVTWD